MAARKPDAPETPTSSSADQTTITIDWQEPYNGGTPITNYKVRWNLGGADSSVFYDLTTVDAATFSYSKSGLTAGELYKFKVVA